MANFIGLVYATLKNEGVDTKGMSTDDAVKKYNELQKSSGGKSGEKEPTPAESKKMNGMGINTNKDFISFKVNENDIKDSDTLSRIIAREVKSQYPNAKHSTDEYMRDVYEIDGEKYIISKDATFKNPKLERIDRSHTKDEIKERVDRWDDEMKYRMLSRMQSDVKYYLGPAGRSNKALWAENPQDHIAYMEEIYSQLKEKPEWLSEKELKQYKKMMLG